MSGEHRGPALSSLQCRLTTAVTTVTLPRYGSKTVLTQTLQKPPVSHDSCYLVHHGSTHPRCGDNPPLEPVASWSP